MGEFCLLFMLVFMQKVVSLYPQIQDDMIKRKADELIRNFILNDRRSLLVTGARQVGKTFSIRKLGKECFDNVVEINFIEQPDGIRSALGDGVRVDMGMNVDDGHGKAPCSVKKVCARTLFLL